jgi:hypothetical protein
MYVKKTVSAVTVLIIRIHQGKLIQRATGPQAYQKLKKKIKVNI